MGDGGKFYFLAPGDRFNLATRQATRPAHHARPVEGPQEALGRGDVITGPWVSGESGDGPAACGSGWPCC